MDCVEHLRNIVNKGKGMSKTLKMKQVLENDFLNLTVKQQINVLYFLASPHKERNQEIYFNLDSDRYIDI